MAMKNDAIFEEELTCGYKIGMRNLTNFDPSTQESLKCSLLVGSFTGKHIMFELKKYRGVIFHGT